MCSHSSWSIWNWWREVWGGTLHYRNWDHWLSNRAHRRKYFFWKNGREDRGNRRTDCWIRVSTVFQGILNWIFTDSKSHLRWKTPGLNLFPNNLSIHPSLLVRKFPKTTPSGFIIGIIFIIALSKKSFSIFYDTSLLINPSATYDPTDSPGWIRHDINTTCLSTFLWALFVKVNMGIANPVKLKVRISTSTIFLYFSYRDSTKWSI